MAPKLNIKEKIPTTIILVEKWTPVPESILLLLLDNKNFITPSPETKASAKSQITMIVK